MYCRLRNIFVCVVGIVSRHIRYMNDNRVKALYNERTVNIAGDIIFDKVFYYINLRGFRIISKILAVVETGLSC